MVGSFFKGEELKKVVGEDKKIIPAYFALDHEEFRSAPKEFPNKAIITGTLWGEGRNSASVSIALKILADEGYLDAYGARKSFKFLKDHYKGFVPGCDSLIDVQSKYGAYYA